MAVSLLVDVFDDEEEDQDEGDDNAAAVVEFGAQHSHDGSNSKTSESREPTTQHQWQEPPAMESAMLPFVPGYEVVGTIQALGDQAKSDGQFHEGKRVAGVSTFGGGNSRFISIPASHLTKISNNVKTTQAVCILHDYTAALKALRLAKKAGSPFTGMNILITSGFSPVRQAVINLANMEGANIRRCFVKNPESWLPTGTGTSGVVIDTSSGFALTKKGSLVCLVPVYNGNNKVVPSQSHQYQLNRAGTNFLSLQEVILPSIAHETNAVLKQKQAISQRNVKDGMPDAQGKDVAEAIETCRKVVKKCTNKAVAVIAAGEACCEREKERERLCLERLQREKEQQRVEEQKAKKERKEARALSRKQHYERQKRKKQRSHPHNKELWQEVTKLMVDIQKFEKEERLWKEAFVELNRLEEHHQPADPIIEEKNGQQLYK